MRLVIDSAAIALALSCRPDRKNRCHRKRSVQDVGSLGSFGSSITRESPRKIDCFLDEITKKNANYSTGNGHSNSPNSLNSPKSFMVDLPSPGLKSGLRLRPWIRVDEIFQSSLCLSVGCFFLLAQDQSAPATFDRLVDMRRQAFSYRPSSDDKA